MKLILLVSLISINADLVGYNRQKSVADRSRLIFQDNESVQDQIILHLVKNHQYKQLRSYLEKIKSGQEQEILLRMKS